MKNEFKPEASILGQLLLMQNVLINLPNENSILSFVCKGLNDIPGVNSVLFKKGFSNQNTKKSIYFPIGNRKENFGSLQFKLDNVLSFKSYEKYVENFIFMIQIILKERHLRHLNDIHKLELEGKVIERTKQLREEIDERKQIEIKIRAAEESSRRNEEYYKNIINNIGDPVFVKDDQSRLILVNDAFCKIFGKKRIEIIDKTLAEDVPIDQREQFLKIDKQVISNGIENIIEESLTVRNGKRKTISTRKTRFINDNGHTFLIGVIHDVTKRKRTELLIKKLSAAVQQSPSIIVISDTLGNLEYVNPKFTELTGYTSSEVIGQKAGILKSGAQDSTFYKEMWETINSGKPWRGQFHNKKKNGEMYWEAASISTIQNESGTVVNFIKIGEDITLQKNTETKLKNALEKAMESDRLKSAFLANMSHEIRTPMNGILGFIRLLSEPNLNKTQIKQYSAIINKSSDRLLKTINDIIDISKIEAGEMTVSIAETSLNNLMDELFTFHSPETNLKGISLCLKPSFSSDITNIITDSTKLHGILTNLIKNAIKYTEKGQITFGYIIKGNFIEFFVEDSGIGIPNKRIKAIFNRFEQADIEDRHVLEGSGLGLAISKAYTEMLGGEISAQSVEGKGSKFIFTIPFVKKTKKMLAVPGFEPGSSGSQPLMLTTTLYHHGCAHI